MKIKCFKCNGKGTVHMCNSGERVLMGLVTFGFSEIMREECDACDGYGYLED